MGKKCMPVRILCVLLALTVMIGAAAAAETSDFAPGSVIVTDLKVTRGLDDSWENILFLGTNSLTPAPGVRSNTVMICSINKNTGAVKITSLMGDTEVRIEGRSRKLSSAYLYGGVNLALRTVNENFGMNITRYVVVDFTGFASIAEKLGGIEVDLTEDEAGEINRLVLNQYDQLVRQGRMKPEDAGNAYYAGMLESGGEKIHLNGMQTLGYARIRPQNSDFGRTERQRKMLKLLMLKLKDKSTVEILGLLLDSISMMKINLDMNTIMGLGLRILVRQRFDGAETFAVPVKGTYREERRDGENMLWDVDFETNKRELYTFIYR